jgi:F-type H+-transporting ATPase subunit a
VPAFPYLFANSAFKINLTTIAMIFLTGLIVIVVLRLGVARMDMRKPRGLQNLIEWAAEFSTTMARDTMPNERAVQSVLPLAFTMLLFLLVANWLGLIATISFHFDHPIPLLGLTKDALATGHGEVPLFDSPTANMSMTLGLAVMVWIISHARGLRHPKIWFKHLFSPNPLGLIEEITNPLTHGMRLYGNIFAGEALLGVMLNVPLLLGFVPETLPLVVIWLLYSGFVSTIQAYVFAILLCLYIGNKSFDEQAH